MMKQINALHAQGLTSEAILNLAHSDSAIRAELVRLLEQNLRSGDDSTVLSSQARYAMRLSTAARSSGVRHSEL